jgi:membrane protein DedA with SNARE-associated domain/membrane-associated phospholipid phosphatase
MLNHAIHHLASYLQLHPTAGLSFAFLSAFAESLAIIGSLIPGTLTMTLVGSMIGSGVLPLKITVLLVFMGAYIGDCLSYYIGMRYKTPLLHHPKLKKYDHWIKQGEHFIQKHGGKGIVIGRFFGPFRSMIPLIAGILSMRLPLFLSAACISALLWTLVYLFPGLMIGSFALEFKRSVAFTFIAKALLLILFLWFLYYLLTQTHRLIMKAIDKHAEHIKTYFETRPILHNVFYRTSLDHLKKQCSYLLAFLTGTFGFLWIAYQVTTQGWFTDLNVPLAHLMHSLHTPFLTHAFSDISLFVDYNICYAWFGLLSWYFFWKREWLHLAIWVILSMFFGYAGIELLKNFYHNIRPEYVHHITQSFSFPSGHTATSIIFFGFLMLYPFGQEKNNTSFSWLRSITLIVLFMVAFSRVFLGFHWLTDVLGGAFYGYAVIHLGYFLSSFSTHPLFSKTNIKAHYFPEKKPTSLNQTSLFFEKKQHIMLLLAASVVFWVYADVHYFPRQLAVDSGKPMQNIKQTKWMHQKKVNIAFIRKNRLGENAAPFNVQWLGPLESIKKTLLELGWKAHRLHPGVWQRLIHQIKTEKKAFYPLFPPLYQNKPPALFMSTTRAQAQWTLRLWHSNITVEGRPLWIGTLSHAPKKHDKKSGALSHKNFDARWLKKALNKKKIVIKREAIYPVKRWPNNLILVH